MEGQGAGDPGATIPGGADAEYFESEGQRREREADTSMALGKRGRHEDDGEGRFEDDEGVGDTDGRRNIFEDGGDDFGVKRRREKSLDD